MTWPEQAYVQIDLVGQFTAAAGCAIYDGGAWPEKWRYAYFTGEPTLNIVHQQFVKPDGVSYTTQKEAGREQTEFIRSSDLWFRPIETRVGPDGALYIVDFYNQAVIHNDTRGPLHGPANAAVRPDRDHYFGRIWRVQHKQATKLDVPVLNRARPAAADSSHADEPERARQEDGVAAGAGELTRRIRGSRRSSGRWAARRSQLYEQARAATTPAQRKAVLDAFAAATDNWTRSALVAAATEQAPPIVAEALTYDRPQALTDFVVAVLPAALPAHAGAIAGRGCRQQAPARRRSKPASCAPSPGWKAVRSRWTPTTTQALQKLLDDPATTAAALPIVAKWDKAGALSAKADSYAQLMLHDVSSIRAAATTAASTAPRACSAVPAHRAQVLAAIAPMLADRRGNRRR